MLLAGDIGGTKIALALISVDQGVQQPIREATFPSRDYDSLDAIIAEFLRETAQQVRCASFGVAGPVVDNRAETTNLPWIIDAGRIAGQFGIAQVRLLNDLEAIAHAVPHLSAADLFTLNTGTAKAGCAIAVIAPGTGLGEAFLTWDGRRYRPHPSEGGHASFAPTTELQRELLTYLQSRMDHVSYERVCSGRGIPNLYAFLRDSGRYAEPQSLRQALAQAEDPTPIIAQWADEHQTPLCVATLDLFVEILGDEAGNLALKVLATGGVYLGGGIPPRILPRLKYGRFLDTFVRKGRFVKLMAGIPVHVICNPKVALYGAAYHGLELVAGASVDE
ncbi:MAG: glucokinase [Anaerolineae bacterium]